ncbi:hypothetical protein X771_08415 [Mesorhizobium sp. LSJC277A00]|nr:hypothetical protein X771_08415 [Mesorhizobium sp. LSJC277A00]
MRVDHELVEIVAVQVVKHFRDLDRPLLPSIRRRFGLDDIHAIAAIRRAAEIRAEQVKGAR